MNRVVLRSLLTLSFCVFTLPYLLYASEGKIVKTVDRSSDAIQFDGVSIDLISPVEGGVQIRDVTLDSPFVAPEECEALKLSIRSEKREIGDAAFVDIMLEDHSGKDRALTLIYSIPVFKEGLAWLMPRWRTKCEPGREYSSCE